MSKFFFSLAVRLSFVGLSCLGLNSVASAQWNQATPANAPSARLESQMAFDANNNQTVLFGGADLGGFPPTTFGDTWTWDGVDWAQAAPTTMPPGRYFGGMAHDPVRGVTVMYGGLQPGLIRTTYLDDTWEWNGTDWTAVTTANTPGSYLSNPGVGELAMAFDPTGLKVVMFGGELFQGIVAAPAETFEYDGTDWAQVNTGVQPPRRTQASMCSAGSLGGVLLFGGTNFNNPPGPNGEILWNDTWVYTSVTSTWTEIVATGPLPPARAGASLHFDSNAGVYVMSGGYNETGGMITPLSDTWFFDGTTWVDVTGTLGSAGGPRIRFASAEAPGGCSILFGGAPSVFGTANNDTWIQGCISQAASYGSGCVGSNGTPSLAAANSPVLGGTFDITAANFEAAGAFGYMMIGLDDGTSPLGTLPVNLQSFGLGAGCVLLNSGESSAGLALTAGAGTFSVGIPNVGQFVGYEAFFQGFSFDAAATGGIAASNGVSISIGY